MSLVSSRILVARAKERDEKAIGLLFDRYRDRLRRGIRRRLGDRLNRALMDSEDAVQDGILAAISALDRFEYRGSGSFLAWVLRVAELEVLQRLRAQSAEMRGPEREVAISESGRVATTDATPSEIAEGRETETSIQRLLDQLEPREREVIVLRRYLDLDTEDIRVEFRLASRGAVRALLSRAQTKLAILMDQMPRKTLEQ